MVGRSKESCKSVKDVTLICGVLPIAILLGLDWAMAKEKSGKGSDLMVPK
jgi:hypothetical protein